ncbi:MAG: WG repeat-containing protein [Candidatus Melainabacteria bacterium]|nr:MAG: WG repeat-containing protein [Candidatus Melainabacteria bacterium]
MDKYGYINTRGEFVVEPQFINATEFVDDFAVAELPHNKASEPAMAVCCVNTHGHVVPIRNLRVHSQTAEGLFEVGKDGEPKGFADIEGNILVPPKYVRVSAFYQNRAVVMKSRSVPHPGQSYSFDLILIDNRGRELRNLGLSHLRDEYWSDGLLRVDEGERTCYVDPDGEIVVRAPEHYSGDFSEGLASFMFTIDKQRYHTQQGYFDKHGRVVIPPTFDSTYNFSEGLAGVKKNNRWFFIDREGNVAITLPEDCADVREFRHGLAGVELGAELVRDETNNCYRHQGGNWGYIDRTGKVVIQPAFIEGMNARLHFGVEGLACVAVKSDDMNERLFGFIDRTGKFVIEPQFIEATHFSSGLAAVKVIVPGFDPADWRDWELIREIPCRGEALQKFFEDYPVYGMTRGEVHDLLGSGAGKKYPIEQFPPTLVNESRGSVLSVEAYGFDFETEPLRPGFDFEILYADDRVAGWRIACEDYTPLFNTSGRWPKVG